MLLVDALYINNGGGKVLLDNLMTTLEQSDIKVFYLLDQRIEQEHIPIKSSNSFLFIKSSLWQRHKFYKKNRKLFKKVFCFASLPPTIKLPATVITYFQQVLYLKVPAQYSFYSQLVIKLKSRISRYLNRNTNFWIVQSGSVRNNLSKKFKINIEKILILPFYPPLLSEGNPVKVKNKFLYVSDGHFHKNHVRLIDAFSKFYSKYKIGELHLTISQQNEEICNKIEHLKVAGLPIFNHGFIQRDSLSQMYKSSEYLIFPSLAESFGLGIIEALENGCKIIGADLPYMHAVCEPSIVFDPMSEESIVRAFEEAIKTDVLSSKQKVFSEIEQLIKLLRNGKCKI